MNSSGRLEKLREVMERRLFDGLLYGVGPNFRYFTGLPAEWRREEEPAEPDALLVLAWGTRPRVILSADRRVWAERSSSDTHLVHTQTEIAELLDESLSGRVGVVPGSAGDYVV